MSQAFANINQDLQASSEFNAAFAGYNQDVTGVYDVNFNQLFPNARPITARVTPSSKLMEHPLESGATIVDHRIINQTEIELSVILAPSDYLDAYNAVKATFLGKSSVTVQTIVDVYPNMYIMAMPYQHTPEAIDTITMIIKLKEAQIASAATTVAIPKSAADAATVTTGAQNGTTQTAPTGTGNSGNTGSAAYDWFYGSKN